MTQPQTNGRRPAIAIVLAGGSGVRFGAEVNKVLVPIGGKPILQYSLDTFAQHPGIDAIVIVARSEDQPTMQSLVDAAEHISVAAIVPGGETRQGSEWAGIQAAATLGLDDPIVLLHDAARPFVGADVISRVLNDANAGGTIPTTPVEAALVDPQGRPVQTDDLMQVQTPQAFSLGLLLTIFPQAEADGFSGVDTAETVQRYGAGPTTWVLGDQRNIKVTHPDDHERAEMLARGFVSGVWR